MDQQEVKDWCDFCEGRVSHDPETFSKMFMGVFAETLGERDKSDLRKVFSYVPNASRALEKLLRIGTREEIKSEQEIIDLVIQDLKEMRRVIDNPEILLAIDLGVSDVIADESRFRQTCNSPLNREFVQGVADYFIEEIYRHPNNDKIVALSDAFYGIANNLHLQYALTADLLATSINCNNYFELYNSGVDYALDQSGVLVFNYRK